MKKIMLFLVFTLTLSIVAYSQKAKVIAENANLRGTPSGSGKVIDTVSQNTALEVIKQKGAWFLVQTTDYVGWINGNTIELTDTKDEADITTVPDSVPTGTLRTMPDTSTTTVRPSSNRTYIRGSRGGCYYINSSGNKSYVDRSLCN